MFTHSKDIKLTRKPHLCLFCERRIEIGESAQKTFYVDSGKGGDYYLCKWCATHIDDIVEEYEYELSGGDLIEYVSSALYGTKCPKCNGKDYDFNVDTLCAKVILSCNDYMEDMVCGNHWAVSLNELLLVNIKQEA